MAGGPYTDLERPPLDAAALNRALIVPGGLWTRIEVRARTGSTNADVALAARDGADEGLVVVAEEQTAGRGRVGRTWQSPARAGLAASVLLRPAEPDPDAGFAAAPSGRYGWLSLLAGVALAGSVRHLAGVDAVLKWPNDLLIGGGKCAGILAEVVPGGTAPGGAVRPQAVVVGIGLNVTMRADELPPPHPIGLPATSLALAGAASTDRDPLLRALLRSFADWYIRWRRADGDPVGCGLREAYLRLCATLDRQVRLALPDGTTLTGTAGTVDEAGRLVVHTGTGTRTVAAGDVLHLR